MGKPQGYDNATIERRKLAEAVGFNLRFIKNNLEIMSVLLKQGIRWMDFPPLWLMNAEERVQETMKLIDEVLDELEL